MTPKRIQRSRTKGWRMPEGAIYVGRPTRWGNPFEVAAEYDRAVMFDTKYRFYYLEHPDGEARFLPVLMLAGHDLACWCPLDQPCHADVLLKLAAELRGTE